MLADALAAERLRLLRARGTLFWAFLFAPIFGALVSWGFAIFEARALKAAVARSGAAAGAVAELMRPPVYLVDRINDAVSSSNIFVVQIFFLVAAASILTADYRWETWRLLTPRNTRVNLMLAKLLTFALATALGLLLLALSGVVSGVLQAVTAGVHLGWARPQTDGLVMVAGVFGLAWLEMMVLGALAAVIAVWTRSGVAVILAPVGIWLAQGFILSIAGRGFESQAEPPLQYLLTMPALAADTAKAALTPAAGVTLQTVTVSLGALIAWIVLLSALAIYNFRCQDLTRE